MKEKYDFLINNKVCFFVLGNNEGIVINVDSVSIDYISGIQHNSDLKFNIMKNKITKFFIIKQKTNEVN